MYDHTAEDCCVLNAEKVLQCTVKSGPNNLSLFKSLQLPGSAGARSSAKLVPHPGEPRGLAAAVEICVLHSARPWPEGGA